MNFEDRFREMLNAKASEIETGIEMPVMVKSRYRRRLVIHAVVGLLVISSVTAASFLGIDYLRADREVDAVDDLPRETVDPPQQSDGPPTESYECPPDEPPDRNSTWTSPVVEIDHGRVEGRPWIFCVRTVETDVGLRPNDPDEPKSEEGFCNHWQFDNPKGSGLDCVFTGQPLDESYFHFASDPGDEEGQADFYFGAVPSGADSVELQIEGAETETGTVYDPKELGVPFKLFVGLVEDATPKSVTVVAKNAQGEEIASRRAG